MNISSHTLAYNKESQIKDRIYFRTAFIKTVNYIKGYMPLFYPIVLLTNSVESRSKLSISKFSEKNFIWRGPQIYKSIT